MKNSFTFVIVIFAGTIISLLAGCYGGLGCQKGSGNYTEQTKALQGIRYVIFQGKGDFFITQGESESLRMEIDDNLLGLLQFKNFGDTLYISSKQPICPTKFNLNLSLKDVTGIDIKGSGNILSKNKLNVDTVSLIVEGSGKIDVNINQAKYVNAVISGRGDMILKGAAERCETEIDGSGNVEALGLICSDVRSVINGSGNISSYSNNKLVATINGKGDVFYKGNPRDIRANINGLGKVNKID